MAVHGLALNNELLTLLRAHGSQLRSNTEMALSSSSSPTRNDCPFCGIFSTILLALLCFFWWFHCLK